MGDGGRGTAGAAHLGLLGLRGMKKVDRPLATVFTFPRACVEIAANVRAGPGVRSPDFRAFRVCRAAPSRRGTRCGDLSRLRS